MDRMEDGEHGPVQVGNSGPAAAQLDTLRPRGRPLGKLSTVCMLCVSAQMDLPFCISER